MGHIQRHHLVEAICAVPGKPVLETADQLIDPLYQRQIDSALESRTLAALRDLLLPRLLSGELRVPAAERMVEAAVA